MLPRKGSVSVLSVKGGNLAMFKVLLHVKAAKLVLARQLFLKVNLTVKHPEPLLVWTVRKGATPSTHLNSASIVPRGQLLLKVELQFARRAVPMHIRRMVAKLGACVISVSTT